MNISAYEQIFFINMLTLDSNLTMEGLDLAVENEELQRRSHSRTATFTLSSSSSSSSSSNRLTELTPRPSFAPHVFESHLLRHSQSLTLDCQRRRPVIEDPYLDTSTLEILNDWMIVSPKNADKWERWHLRLMKTCYCLHMVEIKNRMIHFNNENSFAKTISSRHWKKTGNFIFFFFFFALTRQT